MKEVRRRLQLWIGESPIRGAVFFAIAFTVGMGLFTLVYLGPDSRVALRDVAVILIVAGVISGFCVYLRARHVLSAPREALEGARLTLRPTSGLFTSLSDRFLFWVMLVSALSSFGSVVGFVTGFGSTGRWSDVISFAIMALAFTAAVRERRRRRLSP